MKSNAVAMKTFFLLVLAYGCANASQKLVASAVIGIAQEFYLEQNVQFDLIVYGAKISELNDIVDSFVKLEHQNCPPFKIIYMRRAQTVIRIHRSAILMFDNLDSYQDFHRHVLLDAEFPTQFYFLVYVGGLNELQANNLTLKNSFTESPLILQYESFLVHDNHKSMKLLTFSMFQQPNCRNLVSVEVNRFSKSASKWTRKDFFPEKFKTFNGCELSVRVFFPNEPSVGLDRSRKGENTTDGIFWGYAIEFTTELAYYLNFSLRYQSIDFFANDWMTGLGQPVDFMLFTVSMRKNFAKRLPLTVTAPFTTTDDLIIISRFSPYSQLYKFILPFEEEVWFWLIVTLSITFTTILLLKMTARRVQDFVFGRKIISPMLNSM